MGSMEALVRQQSFNKKKRITKQVTKKRDDTPLHSAAREGDLEFVLENLVGCGSDHELGELLSRKNQSGETVLYVASECGYVDLVKELIKYYDAGTAAVKATNGYDAFHIAAKQGDLGILKVLTEAFPDLSLTCDQSNRTSLHTAASQGHTEIVSFLLEKNRGLATIARSNGKTALHSSARNGHLNVAIALLSKEPEIGTRIDKKGQTALHMAVKGTSTELVNQLIKSNSLLLQMVDGKGNGPLHIAARKGRCQIVRTLLNHECIDTNVINNSGETALDTAENSGETALDTAEKVGNFEITNILKHHGVPKAESIKPPTVRVRELKQTVSDIKHEVHNQLDYTRQTRIRVRGIAKRLNKMHEEGLNNAVNSTTVVAVLFATVTFAAIFSVPGQYEDNPKLVPVGLSLGEARIGSKVPFAVFFVLDSFALFISLAVVVIQTSVVAVERTAKKRMMFFINKLMWLACAFLSGAYLALCFIVVGDGQRLLAVGVTVVGAVIMMVTFGTLCYWVIMHRIEAYNLRSIRKSAKSSMEQSRPLSDSEVLNNEYKNVYAI